MSENENMNENVNIVVDAAEVITVPIDDTLSNSGEAADAYAVGAALALKADKSELGQAIKVNGQSADAQGEIIVTAEDMAMGESDNTLVSEAVAAVAARTGSDIPISSASGAPSIAEAIASGLAVTAEEIPLAEGSSTMVSDELTRLDTVKGNIKTVNGQSPTSNGNVQVEQVDYARNLVSTDVQQGAGTFTERTAGGSATIQSGTAQMQSIRGVMLHTGVVQEVIDVVPSNENLSLTVDNDTLRTAMGATGTKTFTYSGSAWDDTLGDYGITISSGSPAENDTITITYVKASRGLIKTATLSGFKASGYNLFQSSVGYAHVLKYDYPYFIGGSFTKIEYSETPNGTKTTLEEVNGVFDVPADGYVHVTGYNANDTYITTVWTDWTEGKDTQETTPFAAYSENGFDLSGLFGSGKTFETGMTAVGNVYDEIDFEAGQAINRIERMDYDTDTIDELDSAGRAWEADEDYIYAVRTTADIDAHTTDLENLSPTPTGTYTANDHGLEWFTYPSTAVPVYALILYGNNLVRKLERDVLTVSPQSLGDTEKATARTNIGAASAADVSALSDSVAGCAKMTKLSFGSAASFQINVPSNSAHLIIASGGGQRLWIGYVTTSSTGSIQAVEITHGSAFSSITTSTANKVTFTWTSAGSGRVTAIPITGNEISKVS